MAKPMEAKKLMMSLVSNTYASLEIDLNLHISIIIYFVLSFKNKYFPYMELSVFNFIHSNNNYNKMLGCRIEMIRVSI